LIRPGHHAPLGSVTPMRFSEWTYDREPQLGDVALDTGRRDERHPPQDVRRAYLVVGIEEMRPRPGHPAGFRLQMERVAWADFELGEDAGVWAFYHL
jgi:hypothetical protein